MNKKIVKIIIPLFLLVTIGTVSIAKTEGIIINDETFLFDNKENNILLNFDSNFEVENNNNDKDYELRQTIIELTKRTTYLLLGESNNKNESSESYFKRHKEYLQLRYNPKIPEDKNSLMGLDQNSQEYKDDILSGISVPGMFLKLSELEVDYDTYGKIQVSVIDNDNVFSTITLTGVTMKEQDEENPMNYNIIKTNLTMYYYFKKIDNEYKLLYLYGETEDDIKEYIDSNNERRGTLSKDADYNSKLEDIYDFSKANAITDNILNNIYDNNKSKIVFLNSVCNTGTVTTANGFFISEELLATTYNYIENSLIKAQGITISDSLGTVYELDGIVTMNAENDIAILKVKNKNQDYIKVIDIDKIEKEDAVITLSSKEGVGLNTSKGIVTTVDNDIQTSLPVVEEMQGGPLFSPDGNLVGMINSKAFNKSISFATNIDIIKKYYDKFNTENYDDVKATSFDVLKKNYYIKYSEEKLINNIPEREWRKFNKIEDIEKTIGLKLIKGSYKEGIISLRYKNEVSSYINTMMFADEYGANLKNKGYKEKQISNSKVIYENKKYQIIIMTEFDYLIIVMVKL